MVPGTRPLIIEFGSKISQNSQHNNEMMVEVRKTLFDTFLLNKINKNGITIIGSHMPPTEITISITLSNIKLRIIAIVPITTAAILVAINKLCDLYIWKNGLHISFATVIDARFNMLSAVDIAAPNKPIITMPLKPSGITSLMVSDIARLGSI